MGRRSEHETIAGPRKEKKRADTSVSTCSVRKVQIVEATDNKLFCPTNRLVTYFRVSRT